MHPGVVELSLPTGDNKTVRKIYVRHQCLHNKQQGYDVHTNRQLGVPSRYGAVFEADWRVKGYMVSGIAKLVLLKDKRARDDFETEVQLQQAANKIIPTGVIDIWRTIHCVLHNPQGQAIQGEVGIIFMHRGGETLADFLSRGNIAVSVKAAAIREIVRNLNALNAHGIIHSDAHADNFLMLPGNHTAVIDFGLARIVDRPVTPVDAWKFLVGLEREPPVRRNPALLDLVRSLLDKIWIAPKDERFLSKNPRAAWSRAKKTKR